MKTAALLLVLVPLFGYSKKEVIVEMKKHDKSPFEKKEFEYISKNTSPVNAKQRDLFFEKFGLYNNIANFDEVEKNILYIRLKKLPVERIQKLYPKIKKEVLSKAKYAIEDRQ